MSTASSRVPEEWSMVNGSDARSAISGVAEAVADDEDVGRGCTYVRTWILWERIVRAEPSREHKRSKALWREHYTRDHFFRFSLSSSPSLSLSLARALSWSWAKSIIRILPCPWSTERRTHLVYARGPPVCSHCVDVALFPSTMHEYPALPVY